MRYTVLIEEMEGRWLAHVLSLPGCFISADDRYAVQEQIPSSMRRYLGWRRSHGDTSITLDEPIEIEIDESIREWPDPADPDYIVNAFFAADVLPLTAPEIPRLRKLFEWSRADLLASFEGLSHEEMSRPIEGEWSIAGILNHTGRAESWYLDRLDLAPPRTEESQDWRGRLDRARRQLLDVLPQLDGVARTVVKNSETWSPRKMIRRALWHERDHTQHILQFRAKLRTP